MKDPRIPARRLAELEAKLVEACDVLSTWLDHEPVNMDTGALDAFTVGDLRTLFLVTRAATPAELEDHPQAQA